MAISSVSLPSTTGSPGRALSVVRHRKPEQALHRRSASPSPLADAPPPSIAPAKASPRAVTLRAGTVHGLDRPVVNPAWKTSSAESRDSLPSLSAEQPADLVRTA